MGIPVGISIGMGAGIPTSFSMGSVVIDISVVSFQFVVMLHINRSKSAINVLKLLLILLLLYYYYYCHYY